ncbi:pimeloyl-ACP methyl ester carboxylesterase [Salinibacter ruber]|uniref:alpha/beta fold hydrolase n=1 Tax=Salinibacter ruber TaxID=146919 RepID=UPI002169A9FD|nr:alpha/beta hydrolase [Salinibacter ruber]MCS3626240.1 pimeloyl-ACP methyl ester carboxylesterase [Salinibacter ruber]MCS3824878.1 pimeloyl-ACP methyl ester carboxylesterase [Salinibacter ruber]MCS4143315.1 pimeloyl-ACP methyl ester carboxylesterase [Salinibacter ruber]MCS4193067.1 pimeloyl-ACP methyl ester carboxylesterase [Salinibacter ruber]
MQPRIIRTWCALIFVLSFASPVTGQHLPDGAEDWYLEASDGVDLYVVEFGAAAAPGDTVVMLHGGWGAEHSYLWPAIIPLADRYHFVLYDQRGSLRSPAPDSTISLQRFVSDLEDLRRELGQERLTIFAHSMGSRLAYTYLRKHPEHVRRLALAGPLVPTGSPLGDKRKMRKVRKQFVQWAKKREKAEITEEGLGQDSLSDREKTARWRIGFAAGNIYHVERWHQMEGGRAFYNGDIPKLINQNTPDSLRANQFETLRTSEVPVRVIIGDHDLADFGLVSWPAVADTLENVEITTLEKAGHNAWIDRPGKFRDAIRRALHASEE